MFNPPQVDTWYKDGVYATIKYSDGTILSVMNNSHNGFDSAKFENTPEHTPISVEEREYRNPATESARLEFIDFGSTQFVEPHPEVKEEVESLLDRMKIPTAMAQMESHNKQKAMKEGSKIYKGAVINSLRRFTGTDHLHADGWSLHTDQSLTDAQIKEHNLAAYTEFYGSKEIALEIINR